MIFKNNLNIFLLLFIVFFSPLSISKNDSDQIKIKNKTSMVFPLVMTGYRQNIVIDPLSSNSATFTLYGIPYAKVKVSVDDYFYIYSGSKNYIKVMDVTFGGDLDSKGYAYFNRFGEINNVRIGATAVVTPNDNRKKYQNNIKIKAYYE